jgi:hypothetical protein
MSHLNQSLFLEGLFTYSQQFFTIDREASLTRNIYNKPLLIVKPFITCFSTLFI